MAQDSFVQIAPDSTGKDVKTFESYDTNYNLVHAQGITEVDQDGRKVGVLTEQTGQAILAQLTIANRHLAKLSGLL